MHIQKNWLTLTALTLPVVLTACGGGSDNDDDNGVTPAFTLQLLHVSDQEAGAPAVDDAPRLSAVLNALRAEYPNNTAVLSSGDAYIPGPFFSASGDDSLQPLLGITAPGRADILIQNALGFQAIAFGNHEFDLNTGVVFDLLAPETDAGTTYPGAAFPYLSSNLDFSTDTNLAGLVTADGQPATAIPGQIAKSTVITVGGERIGVVGATTPTLGNISSPGGVTVNPDNATDRAALAALIQPSVDALTATGINKIILLAHMQQISVEQELAPLLRDVDIIVAGGSNTILADNTDRLRAGQTAADTYPLQFTSASGQPVMIVNTDGNYRYVGRLVVGFDAAGVLLPSTLNAAESGAYATDEQGVVELGGPAADPDVVALTDAIRAVLVQRESNTFGKTTVYLNGVRNSVRTEETNLGNLSADANLFVAQQFDPSTTLSIKNGGGIRDDIGEITYPTGSTDPDALLFLPPAAVPAAGKEEGEISQFDIQNALRFNNELTLVTVTAAGLKEILEHGVAATAAGATPGQFPQVGGVRFSFDPSRAAGDRVRSVRVLDANGALAGGAADTVVADGVVQGDPARTFRLVALSFLIDDADGDGRGGDNYPFPTLSTERVDLAEQGLAAGVATFAESGSEQDALAEYLAATFPVSAPFTGADVPATQDQRIQNLSVRADTVLAP